MVEIENCKYKYWWQAYSAAEKAHLKNFYVALVGDSYEIGFYDDEKKEDK